MLKTRYLKNFKIMSARRLSVVCPHSILGHENILLEVKILFVILVRHSVVINSFIRKSLLSPENFINARAWLNYPKLRKDPGTRLFTNKVIRQVFGLFRCTLWCLIFCFGSGLFQIIITIIHEHRRQNFMLKILNYKSAVKF